MRRPRSRRSAQASGAVGLFALTTAAVSLGFAALGGGCSDDGKEASAPPPLSTARPAPRDAAVDATAPPPIDASPVDAGPQSRRFTGSLTATTPVDFGGPPYCKYRIALKQIDVDVTLTQAGDVAGGSVTNLAVEEVVPPCGAGPIEANIHKYFLASSMKLPNGTVRIELARDPSNRPEAELAIEGNFSGDKVQASIEWHRTDQGPPLDWRVTSSVPLAQR